MLKFTQYSTYQTTHTYLSVLEINCLFVCNSLVSMPASSHLAQVCIQLEPLQSALVVLLVQVVLGMWVMAGVQFNRWVAVGWRLWTCSLQWSVWGQSKYTFPFWQVRLLLLLLQRNGAQTVNCGEEEREEQCNKDDRRQMERRQNGKGA